MVIFLLFFLSSTLSASEIRVNGHSVHHPPPQIEDVARKHVTRFSQWQSNPDIKICNSAPVTIAQVKNALAWWEKRGYKFGYVFSSSCVENAHYGNIVISLADQKFNFDKNLGTTSVHHDLETKVIRWAQIFLTENVRERVLEHEIGHAIGWHHSTKLGHILYPSWQLGGWDDDGIKNSLNLTREHQ